MTDSAGFGAVIIVTIAVVAAAHHPYDANATGVTERDEVIRGVGNFFEGSFDKNQVIEVIKMYFTEGGRLKDHCMKGDTRLWVNFLRQVPLSGVERWHFVHTTMQGCSPVTQIHL